MQSCRGFKATMPRINSVSPSPFRVMRFCTPLQVDSIRFMSEPLISDASMKTFRTWWRKKEAGFELDRIARSRCLAEQEYWPPLEVTVLYFTPSILREDECPQWNQAKGSSPLVNPPGNQDKTGYRFRMEIGSYFEDFSL
jgi:hypothetical protein